MIHFFLSSVSIPTLIKQEIENKTPLGASMKPYITRQSLGKRKRTLICIIKQDVYFSVPDALLMQIIRDRLNQKDCLTKGWIMIGFPRTRDQAESLARVPLMAPTR